MLTAKVLNPNATLNSFQVQDTLEFVPGTIATLIIQLFDDAESLRYVPPSTASVKITFNNADGSTLVKTASLNADDRSLATITLLTTDTSNLIGGNALLAVDLLNDGTRVIQGLIFNCLQKVTIDS